ncbi:hypothetical protein DXK94_16995 [Arthrobacter sp. RT-1]|uniref:hypothetical protein n=1 Tax=Arthrobacter sp. RT-1 TaxID=2292263 RepID=UPI000E1F6512|nr:hypothetical protein [Arthrobacter sp. RT-1]RDV08981.1 hypothetical protein DXK94_16995 [Arthrobacter sp. RT-1]
MSQEQPPIRSRRELRKARDAQQASVSTGTDQLPPAHKPEAPQPQAPQPQAGAPQPAAKQPATPGAAGQPAAGQPGRGSSPSPEQTHTQRSSQIRARDRAALRTIKELEEKEGQLATGGAPTRRQLRLQQLKEQALTAANPIVPPAGGPSVQAGSSAQAGTAQNGPAAGPLATGSSQSTPAAAEKKPAAKTAGPTAKSTAATANATSGSRSGVPDGMTVEQALQARALIAEQAKNQIAKMEHIASLDPEAVDPDILAEQIALAERAAVMNRRALAKQKLAEQAGTLAAPGREPGTKDRPAPSTANNLAMVTPLEFVQVPGVDRPVMKPPATSHVPVTTRPGSKVQPDTKAQPGIKAQPGGAGKRRPASRPNAAAADAASGRSQVIARAEAAARAATRPKPVVFPENPSEGLVEDLPRVPASSAYGLDPLDAATAGLARAKRNRILQLCILLFGLVALISGIFLIISGMSS